MNDNTFLSLQIGRYKERLGLMTTGFGNMASRAFEIPEAGFGKIKGSKPRIVGTMAAPSYTDNEAGSVTAGNGRTRRVNPLMASGACPFLESNDP